MGKYTQSGRALSITTQLDADALLLERFSGTEGLSQLFHFALTMLAEKPVDFKQVLGKPATVKLTLPNGTGRFIHGILGRLTQADRVAGPMGDETFVRYRAELVPELWLLTRRVQSRIFQQFSVPDILQKVLKDEWSLDVSLRLVDTYAPRNYCVQYRESDFAFVGRLMEEEGICYFFEHSDQGHTLVITDNATAFRDLMPSTLVYDRTPVLAKPAIRRWAKTQQVRAGKHTLQDWSFQLPDKELTKSAHVADSVSVGSVSHALGVTSKDSLLETFEFPARSGHRFDAIDPGGNEQPQQLQHVFEYQDHLAKVREEREVGRSLCVRGRGTVGSMVPGSKFTLSRHADADGSYYLTRVHHRASIAGSYTSESGGAIQPIYENQFECLPAALPYRPRRRTRRPRIEGTQSATVVGPTGDDLFVDKFGRVKVQFHWDRLGKANADSSCWVRVSQAWAGQTWGTLTLPRVGQEVIVGFEHGDPDRPLILGSLYNAAQMPPYRLPAEKYQSGTVSSSGSAAEKFHEIRIDDTDGKELMLLHSQRDLVHESENDHHVVVGNDHATAAGNSISFEVAGMSSGSGSGGGWDSFMKSVDQSALGGAFSIKAPTIMSVALVGNNFFAAMYTSIVCGMRSDIRGPLQINLGWGWNLERKAGSTTKLEDLTQEVKGAWQRVFGERTSAALSDNVQAVERNTVVATDSSQAATRNSVAATDTSEAATRNSVAATDTSEAATRNVTSGDETREAATVTSVAAEETRTVESAEEFGARIQRAILMAQFMGVEERLAYLTSVAEGAQVVT